MSIRAYDTEKADATVSLEFEVDKTTKGTVRFTERDEGVRPHTFYMLNELHAQLGEPTRIVMTIDAA